MTDALEALAERIRGIISDDPNISERKMFGGICFMLNGNMLCGVTKQGVFMARVGKEREAEARQRKGARDMDFTGRKMGGMLFVEKNGIATNEQLRQWIILCTEFAGTLPAK